MDFITKELKQGITLHYAFCDKFTSNQFSAHFILPLKEESASLYCLLTRVLKKATALHPSQEAVNKRLEELYAATVGAGVTKLGENESFFITANMLDNRFSFDGTDIEREVLTFAKEILFAPLLENGVFSEKIVVREKKSQIDRIRAGINNKNAYAVGRCREVMCADERYRFSLLGTEENAAKITPAELYDAYLEVLSSAKVEVIYIGKSSPDEVCALALDFLDGVSPRNAMPLKTDVLLSADRVRRVTETVYASQGNLVMGFRTGCEENEEDAFVFMLFDAIYGSSPVSKLFMNVREKLSLCYHCSSRYDRHKGVMMVTAGIENKNKDLAEKEIMAQLEEIQKGNVTENEFLYAKEALYDAFRTVTDSQGSMENWRLHQSVRASFVNPEEAADKLRRLTLDDVVRVANKITLDTVYFLAADGTGEDETDD